MEKEGRADGQALRCWLPPPQEGCGVQGQGLEYSYSSYKMCLFIDKFSPILLCPKGCLKQDPFTLSICPCPQTSIRGNWSSFGNRGVRQRCSGGDSQPSAWNIYFSYNQLEIKVKPKQQHPSLFLSVLRT